MCGIAGYLDVLPGTTPNSILGRMTEAIRHRGPDAHGLYQRGPVSLGHRRLSIVDLSPLGKQPMCNEQEDLWIVYNGEIFNHAALRPELEARGHRYRSRTDTETILHGWEEYGPAVLDRFRGMFAFALWEEKTNTLFCARDRMGIKPFYYYWDGSAFVFASEIKALLEHPAVSAVFDDSQLAEYLAFGYLSGEATMFRGVRRLLPGHWLKLQLAPEGAPRLSIERYWDVPVTGSTEPHKDEQAWVQECRQRLEETVEMRLMSDVPLGVFLSGGVDSSAIAALTARMRGAEPLHTFSVGYAESAYSELPYAQQVANHIGSVHHEVRVGMEEFFTALPKLIWHEDEPITWPSSVSLYFVAKLAAEQVTVVLTGEGSDELFAGYARYRQYIQNQKLLPYYRWIPQGMRSGLRRLIAEAEVSSAGALRRKLRHTLLGREDRLESLHLDNFYCAFSGQELQTLMRKPPASDSIYSTFLQYWDESRPLLNRMLYADQKTYLAELLMKQDQMSMANSIESRVPLLDHTFVEFAARIPDSLKIHGTEQKYIFKKAVEDLLPSSIVYRRKMGFPTPLRDWLRRPEAASLLDPLLHGKGLVGEYLDPKAVNSLIQRHRSGSEDGTDALWRLINLELWGQTFIEKTRETVAP